MSDVVCMRADAWMTSQWVSRKPRVMDALHSGRYLLAFLVIAFSVADLLLTQTILTMVEGSTGVQPGEANALMAPIIMTWWAWPLRIGIPAVVVLRDLRNRNYNLMVAACLLYGAVVAWNTHMYMIVTEAIS